MSKKKIIPITLIMINLLFLVWVFLFSPPIDWQNQLNNNQIVAQGNAFETVDVTATRDIAVLTTRPTKCEYRQDNGQHGLPIYPASSWLVYRRSGDGVFSSLNSLIYRGIEDATTQITRDGQDWQWTGSLDANNIKGRTFTCRSKFMLINYPGESIIHLAIRILVGPSALVILLSIFYLIGVNRKKKSSTAPHSTDKNSQRIYVTYSHGGIARGGSLFLEEARIVFEPTALEAGLTDTKALEIPYSIIASVDKAPRTNNLFDGGLRKRLRIKTKSGQEYLFVVNGVDKAIDAIQQKLPTQR